MDSNELKKLNRKQLLELLLKQTVRVEELENRLQEMEHKLEDKTLVQQEIGSIAEASLKLNGVFEAAEAAAAQYVDSVRNLSGSPKTDGDRIEMMVRQKARKILEEREQQCRRREAEADRKIAEADMKVAEAEKVMAAVKRALQKVVMAEQPEDAVDRLFFSILGK